MSQIVLFILAPLLGIVYAFLEHVGAWDHLLGRKQALKGLRRLRSASGYPTNWIYDESEDKEIFEALFQRIKKHTREEKIRKVLTAGHRPSLIATAGQPLPIQGVIDSWPQGDRYLYSENHPVLLCFGVYRSEQGPQRGKGDKVCTLKDIDDWLREEKENRKFYVGTLMVGILSIGLIVLRLTMP